MNMLKPLYKQIKSEKKNIKKKKKHYKTTLTYFGQTNISTNCI